jgi:hypothetical protein
LLLKVVSLLLHGVEALLLQSADRTHQPLPGAPLERQILQRDLFASIDYSKVMQASNTPPISRLAATAAVVQLRAADPAVRNMKRRVVLGPNMLNSMFILQCMQAPPQLASCQAATPFVVMTPTETRCPKRGHCTDRGTKWAPPSCLLLPKA